MFVLARTITYASIFIGLFVVFVPARLLTWSGIVRPESIGVWQVAGMLVGAGGTFLVLWCVFTFAFVGRGTPAPFDAPRRLVAHGPYRFVRNPMYIGAALILAGAAVFYESAPFIIYTALFLLITHVFVVAYEEPTLLRLFGSEYEDYCGTVRRWRPGRTRGESGSVSGPR
jgi:protein-S-isoprenylcysteine O-methyltransferase Ste14